MPIPRQWSQSDTADNVLDMLTGTGNPLSLIKGPMNVKGATFSEIGAIAGKLARNWAKFPQAEGEHVVTLTNKTQVLTMMYERQDQAVKDVLLYSPVLVYWDNIDKRDNGEYISYLIQSRQKGITIVNE